MDEVLNMMILGIHGKSPTLNEIYTHNAVGWLGTKAKIIKYEDIVNNYFKNIDPFDFEGQFCDKGESYRPAIFYQNKKQKKIIEKKITEIKKKNDKKNSLGI